jgi:hypothetical protein
MRDLRSETTADQGQYAKNKSTQDHVSSIIEVFGPDTVYYRGKKVRKTLSIDISWEDSICTSLECGVPLLVYRRQGWTDYFGTGDCSDNKLETFRNLVESLSRF